MAITTLDGMLAGVQPLRSWGKNSVSSTRLQSSWGQTGFPGAGSFNTTLNGGTYTGPVNGMLPRTDPGGGSNAYVCRTNFGHLTGTSGGYHILADRLWDNGGIDVTITTAQSITSPTWPSRDQVGGTTGVGVLLGLEISATVVGAATPTITVSYTNSGGTSGRSASNISATIAAPTAGLFWDLSLQAGDVGVRSVQSITLSNAWTSGTINLVAFRVLTVMASSANFGSLDAITGGFPRVFNGSVLFWLYQLSITPGVIFGTYVESQG